MRHRETLSKFLLLCKCKRPKRVFFGKQTATTTFRAVPCPLLPQPMMKKVIDQHGKHGKQSHVCFTTFTKHSEKGHSYLRPRLVMMTLISQHKNLESINSILTMSVVHALGIKSLLRQNGLQCKLFLNKLCYRPL